MRALLILAVALIAAGCGGEDSSSQITSVSTSRVTGGWVAEALATPEYESACSETAGCEESGYPAPASAETLWRVLVVRNPNGEIRIDTVDAIEVPEGDGVPVGPLASSHALVGLDSSGTVIDGQPIRFPETLRVEHEDSQLPTEVLELTGQEVSTIGFVRADSAIASLAVQETSGETLTSTAVSTRVASAQTDTAGSWSGLARPAWAAIRSLQGLPPYCSHVVILEGEQDRDLAGGIMFGMNVVLVRPGPYQLAATRAALNRLTPLLCQSIGRIAFGSVPGDTSTLGAVNSFGAGDLMLLNTNGMLNELSLEQMLSRRLFLQATIAHEAGHTAETLLHVESSDPPEGYGGAWGFPARTLAKKTVDNVRLEKGLEEEWRRLHRSFVEHEWAAVHLLPLESWEHRLSWPRTRVAESGFMAQGGMRNWAEDIATFVGMTYLSEDITRAYRENGVSEDLREDFGCQAMQSYTERNLPARFSAVYTKLRFLEDLGMVDPEDVRTCMGDHLSLPIDAEGFHVWQGTMKLRSFENQLKAGIGTKAGGIKVYQMEAHGEANFGDKTYPAAWRMQLDLDARLSDIEKTSWPRGIYELGLMGNNNVTLRLAGAKAGNFDAMNGFVLVAESSNDRIAGSIVLQRVFRLQAPLPVPEKYDPPLVVRFMIEN